MSRNQQLILGALGMAIVLVYGCLGAYVLIYLTDGVSTQTAERPPALGTPPDTPIAGSCPTTGPGQQPPAQAPDGPAPTNTRVIPLGSPAPGEPAPAPTSSSAQAPQTPDTPLPTHSAEPALTPPAQATSTAVPSPTPPALPASPTPDSSCAEDENAHHQQMLADIEAEYEPMLTWIEDEMEQASRDGDDMQMEELQLELDMYQNMKAADINAEIARHEAALAACNP
jgi:hypothetical protein